MKSKLTLSVVFACILASCNKGNDALYKPQPTSSFLAYEAKWKSEFFYDGSSWVPVIQPHFITIVYTDATPSGFGYNYLLQGTGGNACNGFCSFKVDKNTGATSILFENAACGLVPKLVERIETDTLQLKSITMQGNNLDYVKYSNQP